MVAVIDEKTIPLEKEIQRKICDYLAKEGKFFWRSNNIPVFATNNGGQKTFRSLPKHTPRGLPDIIMVYRSKFIAFEVKRPGAKLRPEQAEFGIKCEDNGGYYFAVHSVDEVKESLDKIEAYLELCPR